MKTDTFRFYGSFNASVDLGLNTVTGMNLNPLFVEFYKTKTLFEAKNAEMEVVGTMYGDRKYRPGGKLFAYEKTNNIFI